MNSRAALLALAVGAFAIGTTEFAPMGLLPVIAEERLGVRVGGTTTDGMFTLERAECQAACTEAPCLQVNYRYRFRVTPQSFDSLLDDLRAGRLASEIPDHGTLATVRQGTSERIVGAVAPENVTSNPEWFDGKAAL